MQLIYFLLGEKKKKYSPFFGSLIILGFLRDIQPYSYNHPCLKYAYTIRVGKSCAAQMIHQTDGAELEWYKFVIQKSGLWWRDPYLHHFLRCTQTPCDETDLQSTSLPFHELYCLPKVGREISNAYTAHWSLEQQWGNWRLLSSLVGSANSYPVTRISTVMALRKGR